MIEQANQKPNAFFWIIGVLALAWNAMGVYMYLMNVYLSEEAFAQMSEAEQTLYENIPAWVTGAFAIAVFAGFLGSIGLLLKKKWAAPLFALSLIALVIHQGYNQLAAKLYTVSGTGTIFFSLMLILIAVALYLYARSWSAKGWLK